MFWSGLAGPVPLDDIFVVGIREAGGPNFLTGSIRQTHGFTSGNGIIGTSDGSLALNVGLDRYVVPGAPVQAEWSQYHANLTIVASGVVAGLLWDPTGAAFVLDEMLVNGNSPSGASLSAILAAVTKTVTNAP